MSVHYIRSSWLLQSSGELTSRWKILSVCLFLSLTFPSLCYSDFQIIFPNCCLRKKKHAHTYWFTSQVPAITGAGPGLKLGPESQSPTWVSRTQLLEPLMLVSKSAIAEDRIRIYRQESNTCTPLGTSGVLTGILTTRLNACPVSIF